MQILKPNKKISFGFQQIYNVVKLNSLSFDVSVQNSCFVINYLPELVRLTLIKSEMATQNMIAIVDDFIQKLNMDKKTFAQVIKVFNITLDYPFSPNPFNTINQKLKNKIFDIFLTEGGNFRDYLSLPKFSILQKSTLESLNILFYQIWNEYSRKTDSRANDQLSKEIEKLVPNFSSIQDLQEFHLQMLQSFKSSRFCKQNQPDVQQTKFFISEAGAKLQKNFPQRERQDIYLAANQSKFSNSQTNNMGTVYTKIEHDAKFSNPIWCDQINNNQTSSFPFPKIDENDMKNPDLTSRRSLKQKDLENNIGSYSVQVPYQGSDQIQNQEEKKTYLTGSQNEFNQKLHDYMFSECVCEGNLKESSAYMTCKYCQFCFHYQCLFLDSDTSVEQCPCCKLKQGSNIFMKIHPEAYGKKWCKNLKTQKFSMFLTQREMQRIEIQKANTKKLSKIELQLRFLRIKVKEDKQIRSMPSQSTKKINSITLPPEFVENIKPYHVFDIMIRESQNQKQENFIYFFAIFLVEILSEITCTNELFSNLNEENSVGEQALQNYLNGRQFINIRMNDLTSRKKILYPVRGDRCNHAEVFDYKMILLHYKSYGENFKQKHCEICGQIINKVIADRFLFEKINFFYRLYPQKQITHLKYLDGGKVQFTIQQIEAEPEPEPEQDNEEESQNQSYESQDDDSQSISV